MHLVPHSLQKRKRRAPFGLAGLAAAAVLGYAFMQQPARIVPHAPPTQIEKDNANAVAKAQTTFGIDLFGKLTEATPDKNLVVSPASVATILTLTMDGAGSATRSDMARALHLSLLPAKAVNDGSKSLTHSYAHVPGVTLSVANALWANRGVTFAPAFQFIAKGSFNADAQSLDFNSPSAAEAINAWVATHTDKHITQIVTPDVTRGASVVLTNAVFFQGKWQNPFDKDDTQNAPFTLADGSKQSVPMMAHTDEFGYQENATFQAVRLPYGDGRFVMDVYLPKGKLGAFLPTVTEKNWQTWDKSFKPAEVEVHLPRWKMQYEQELTGPLKSLGMGTAFTRAADFAPMGLPKDCISAVLHKATIDVDESGTVATAATAVGGMVMSAPPIMIDPPVFRADHPFLFAITDMQSGALLFVGTVFHPKQ